MDPETFLDALDADYETELSRLASSKVLYALTGGELEADAVRAVMAARAAAAASTFEAWAAETTDDSASATFENAAAVLRADAEAIGADRAGIPDPGLLFEYLAELADPVERAAGLAAWSLVEDGVRRQAVGFFVGNADPGRADRFRERRATVAAVRDDALDRLDTACVDEADWDRAVATAAGAIEAAYEQYVSLLDGMGVTVKPVC